MTDQINKPASHFTGTGRRVVVGRPNGGVCARFLYVPTAEAVSWDGADGATHAIGTRHGGYAYATIAMTGRKDVWISCLGCFARKLAITIAVGTDDEETIEGWLVGGADKGFPAGLA